MKQATMIQRMSKNLRYEAERAASKISIDGYTVTDLYHIACDEDAATEEVYIGYEIWYYRNGEEVIAVPDFYISEEGVSLVGSRGGEYTLNGETLVEA